MGVAIPNHESSITPQERASFLIDPFVVAHNGDVPGQNKSIDILTSGSLSSHLILEQRVAANSWYTCFNWLARLVLPVCGPFNQASWTDERLFNLNIHGSRPSMISVVVTEWWVHGGIPKLLFVDVLESSSQTTFSGVVGTVAVGRRDDSGLHCYKKKGQQLPSCTNKMREKCTKKEVQGCRSIHTDRAIALLGRFRRLPKGSMCTSFHRISPNQGPVRA